jgi:hypothetical protein
MHRLSVDPRPRDPNAPTWRRDDCPSGLDAEGREMPVDFERFLASVADLPRSRYDTLSCWWSGEEEP